MAGIEEVGPMSDSVRAAVMSSCRVTDKGSALHDAGITSRAAHESSASASTARDRSRLRTQLDIAHTLVPVRHVTVGRRLPRPVLRRTLEYCSRATIRAIHVTSLDSGGTRLADRRNMPEQGLISRPAWNAPRDFSSVSFIAKRTTIVRVRVSGRRGQDNIQGHTPETRVATGRVAAL